jgi:hypothetical protein
MTASIERRAAAEVASWLSPVTWVAIGDLMMSAGMLPDEIDEAVGWLLRHNVRVFESDLGLQASIATWQRCQAYGADAAD